MIARAPLLIALLAGACGGSTSAPLVDAMPAIDADTASDAAATDATTATDPAAPGPYAFTTATASIPGATSNRTLPATVVTPTGAPTPAPLVIVSPGFQLDRAQYTSYAEHLASWGFVAILTDYADRGFSASHALLAADVPAVIDWALAELAVDGTRIGVAGHSLGGRISVLAAAQDPRIGAVVGWDPVDATGPSAAPEQVATLTAPLAVVGEITNATGGIGGMSCAPAAENFQQFYAAAPAPALAITVANADHFDWVDDPTCFVCGFCTDGTADNAVARTVTRRVDVAWFRRHLLDDTAMDRWLATPPELATGAVSIQQR